MAFSLEEAFGAEVIAMAGDKNLPLIAEIRNL
jgi:hypothetical protein